jgi:hypothetical protein
MYGILSVTVGARHVNDDSRTVVVLIGFPLDGGEGSEEEAAGKGHDGGAARGDLVAGLELIELAEGMVDVDGRAEFFDVADEGGGNVGLVEFPLAFGGVLEAEAGVRIGDGQAAEATPGGGAMLAMERFGSGDGASDSVRVFGIHESSFLGILGTHPGSFRKSGKQRR